MRRFELDSPDRVVFGVGREAQVGEELARVDARRVLVVSGARRAGADRVAAQLGQRSVGVLATAAPQVPRAVAHDAARFARDAGADWVVAHGGGSAIGLAKAIALELDVAVAAVPTTYAGSERTDIWGITDGGRKTTGRDARVRPRLVVYDPVLTASMPRDLALRSLLNALAHSIEALWSTNATDAATHAARRSLRPAWEALLGIGAGPNDLEPRVEAAYAAYLAAEALQGAAMALHHKLAHVLGGSFGTEHAATHASLLPHTLAWNGAAAPAAVGALQHAWGEADPPAALWDLMKELGLRTSGEDLGLERAMLREAAKQATQKRYPNPRATSEADFEALLSRLWHDRRPSLQSQPLSLLDRGSHTLPGTSVGELARARVVVIAVHGRGSNADSFLGKLRGIADPGGVAWLAPQASGNTWYPRGYRAALADNQPFLNDALSTLDAAWAEARLHLPAERIVLLGFSQGACLALTWLRTRPHAPGAVLAFSGDATPLPGDYAQLVGVPVHLAKSQGDPWIPHEHWLALVDELRAAGAELSTHPIPGDTHALHPQDERALRDTLERLTMDDLQYLTGYGNHLRSEAEPGAIPARGNTPRVAPYRLHAEQINGTGFTVHRRLNRRTWLYRLRPQIHNRPWAELSLPRFESDFSQGLGNPEVQRYRPVPSAAEAGTDFIAGIDTVAGAGDPAIKRGVATHVYSANADMDRVFANTDGDLLVAPWDGALRVRTELGWLTAEPGHILILPRSIRFQVFLPDGASRGFISELYDGHYELPERGPMGANGAADERHFQAPVASYENKVEDIAVVVKQGGRFWQTIAPHSPFDVVGWHGNYAPFRYDLMDFNSYGSVSWDHVDPSILTVLTAPMDTMGRNAIDVAVFRGRWDTTEDTFRPPFLHRNSAIEFNMVIKAPLPTGAYEAGVFSVTPYLTPHGVAGRSTKAAQADVPGNTQPRRGSDESLWLQFESTYALKVLPRWFEQRERGFLDSFVDYPESELAE